MLSNVNQPIVAGLLSLSVAGIVGATALQFNDRIEYEIGNRIESSPAWLVPPKAEFRSIERGYGGIKILLSLLATGGMATVMLIARKEGELEPARQRIKGYQNQADEFEYAAESAYRMAGTQMRYKKLAEAGEVAFEGEIEAAYCESLGIDPSQQQPALTGTATLESVTNPGDKVTDATSKAIESGDEFKYLDQFLRETCLIWGNQGSGKSWTARLLAKRKKQDGYRLIVLDPDSNRSEWQGAESYHLFEDIEKQIRWYISELKKRYRGFNQSTMSEDEWRANLEPIAFICDEITTYENFLDPVLLEEFFKLALTKSRKQEMPCTFVAHNNTQLAFGKKLTGLGNLIEKTLQLELVTTTDPKTLKAKSSGKGRLKGYEFNQIIDVLLPKCDRKITDFRVDQIAPAAPTAPTTAPDRTNDAPTTAPLLHQPFGVSHPPHHPIPEGWKKADPANITPLVRGVIVACVRCGWGQTKTIQEVFGIVKSGSNPSYDLAREIVREISESIGN